VSRRDSCVRQKEGLFAKTPSRTGIKRLSTTIMTCTLPYHGHFNGGEHLFAIRVYFEDTDFSGVVYHARYLHFCERARSDMLSCVGIGQRAAHEAGEGAYAVTQMALKFKRPAHFDDALLVTSKVTAIRAASVDIHQQVSRNHELLFTAHVTAAFVAPDGKPKRQPTDWVAAFKTLLPIDTNR
jgi:acyl-CoA thioester hydrolase